MREVRDKPLAQLRIEAFYGARYSLYEGSGRFQLALHLTLAACAFSLRFAL